MVAFFLEMMGLVKLIRPAGHSVLTCFFQMFVLFPNVCTFSKCLYFFQMFVLFGFGQMYEYIVQYSASVEVIAYTVHCTVVTTIREGGCYGFFGFGQQFPSLNSRAGHATIF